MCFWYPSNPEVLGLTAEIFENVFSNVIVDHIAVVTFLDSGLILRCMEGWQAKHSDKLQRKAFLRILNAVKQSESPIAKERLAHLEVWTAFWDLLGKQANVLDTPTNDVKALLETGNPVSYKPKTRSRFMPKLIYADKTGASMSKSAWLSSFWPSGKQESAKLLAEGLCNLLDKSNDYCFSQHPTEVQVIIEFFDNYQIDPNAVTSTEVNVLAKIFKKFLVYFGGTLCYFLLR